MTAMKVSLRSFFVCVVFFLAPFSVSAQIAITEIMYDLETGSDSGREWIEVWNSRVEGVDLSAWRLFEAETNHRIEAEEEGGPTMFGGGEYAVISDNPAKFLADWPGYAGLLFDSAFSLGNTGEMLVLRDGELIDKDTVTYNATWGADGDGKSLQLVAGEWIAATPTPGEENEAIAPPEPPPAVNNQNPPSAGAYVPTPAASLFSARISEKEKFAVVGAGVLFKGETVGTADGLSGKTRFLWNFGDGGTGEGESVLHIYKYPGEYVVILNAVSGTHSPEDRATVKAIPSELSISNIGTAGDFFIELSNNSAYELNLSGWLLKSGARYFVIPEHSFILPKKKIIFPQEVTNLSYSTGDTVGLLYPNGLSAAVFSASPKAETVPPVAEKKKERTLVAAVKTAASSDKPDGTVKPELAPENKKEKALLTAAIQPVTGKKAKTNNRTWPWLFGTLAFVAIGGAAVVVARRGKTPADEFAITEEEGNDTA